MGETGEDAAAMGAAVRADLATARPGTASGGRPGTASIGRPGTAGARRPGTANGGRPGTAGGGRPGTAGGRRGSGPAAGDDQAAAQSDLTRGSSTLFQGSPLKALRARKQAQAGGGGAPAGVLSELDQMLISVGLDPVDEAVGEAVREDASCEQQGGREDVLADLRSWRAGFSHSESSPCAPHPPAASKPSPPSGARGARARRSRTSSGLRRHSLASPTSSSARVVDEGGARPLSGPAGSGPRPPRPPPGSSPGRAHRGRAAKLL